MIVCGVDESGEAAQAARFAADLAVRVGTELVLLHVAPEPWVSTHSPEYDERIREEEAFDRAGHLATVVNPIRIDPAASAERVVAFGQPVEVLRSIAEDRGASHLVVGSRGQGAVEEILAASTSGPLAREAPCPVILVPAEPVPWSEGSSGATIVCGVDGSDGAREAAQEAGELALRLDARLVLAMVIETLGDETPDTLVDEIRAGAPGVGVSFQTLNGVAADELLELARRREARLLVVGSRGRGAVKAAVLGSVSGRLVQQADRPIMVVSRPPSRRA
jgi:nucleotide-binding universal stress UspA family protein